MASPRCFGPTRSIFMMTVVDQHRPWLTPSSRLASTIQPQLGAKMSRKGTGRPNSQPATRICFRPIRSESRPANRLASALTIPKLTINERASDFEVSPKSASAMRGTTVRSKPTIAPTKALTMTSNVNCCQLARNPSFKGLAVEIEVDGSCISALRDRTVIASSFQLGGILDQLPRFIKFNDTLMIRGYGWDSSNQSINEF